MSKYIIRLDDACEKRNIENWNRMENLLDKYKVKPLVGIIPDCRDPMMDKYEYDNGFWDLVDQWVHKGWVIAMHGYQHLYTTKCGGINPVNLRSEFAGESYETQKNKIKNGILILKSHGITPKVFFAPSHTFDENTISAIKEESDIRIISDTVANKPYVKDGITFVPQQSGTVRKLPFSVVTFCYHPNTMSDSDFYKLESFLQENTISPFPTDKAEKKMSFFDKTVRTAYFLRRKK